MIGSIPQIGGAHQVDLPGHRPAASRRACCSSRSSPSARSSSGWPARASSPAGRATRAGAGSTSSSRRRCRACAGPSKAGSACSPPSRVMTRRPRGLRRRSGIATQGGESLDPVLGVGVLGLATAAFAGVGLAVGGLVRASLAAPVAAGLVIATLPARYARRGARPAGPGARPVAVPPPRPADGRRLRAGRDPGGRGCSRSAA